MNNTVPAESTVESAKQFFLQYAGLEAVFDRNVANLYAVDAKIQNTRIYPDGTRRVLTMPASNYKQLIRQTMSIAATRGDTNTYSDIAIAHERDKFRVTGRRFSTLKKTSSPLSLLIGQNNQGAWRIYEELSESHA